MSAPLWGHVDAQMMQTTILNVLSNAVKFSAFRRIIWSGCFGLTPAASGVARIMKPARAWA